MTCLVPHVLEVEGAPATSGASVGKWKSECQSRGLPPPAGISIASNASRWIVVPEHLNGLQ